MSDQANTPETPRRGKTTIAPEVLLNIARLAALGVPGVVRMSPVPGGVNRLFQRGVGDGVRIELRGHAVNVDLYLVLKATVHIGETSRAVQAEVSRAIREMVGMDVLAVNVTIEDVIFAESGQA